MIALQLKCHAECRVEGENWAGMSSAAERRKLQNRLNQRAFRRRKAARWTAEQVSRGGSVDSASASTSIQQSGTSSPQVDSQRQEPSSFADKGQVDIFDPTWEQALSMNLQSDPWILSAPDLWGAMTRETEQCEMNAVSYHCREKTSRKGKIEPRNDGDDFLNQSPIESFSHKDLSSSPWLDSICDEAWLELWLKSTSTPLAAGRDSEPLEGSLYMN